MDGGPGGAGVCEESVRVSAYVNAYACEHVCLHVHVCELVSVYLCVSTWAMGVCEHVYHHGSVLACEYLCVCMCVPTCACMFACVSACLCVCEHVCASVCA